MDETLRFLHKVFSTKEPAYVHELLAPMQKLNDTHGTPSHGTWNTFSFRTE